MGNENYPIEIKTDKVLGRHFVASRNIEPGELIFEDDPIILSPNAPTERDLITCIGCCGVSRTSVPCSRCGWPVCKEECADIPDHQNFECQIFMKENVKHPLSSPYCFIAEAEYIKVLRCLLLCEYGKEDPVQLERWNMLMDLEAHVELRKTIPKLLFMSKLIRNFIQEVCKLYHFEESVIDYVLGVVDVNAFRNSTNPMFKNMSGPCTTLVQKNATAIYRKGSIPAHACQRNIFPQTFPNGKLEMRACTFIRENEIIAHGYVDLMIGTPERRKQIKDQFYFECTCARCADPTELGTYFSALKCSQCSSGYLLMDNPLDMCPYWKCDKCPEIQTTEYETELLAELRKEESKILLHNQKNSAMLGHWLELLSKFGDKFHENHYALWQIRLHLIRCMAKVPKPQPELVDDMHMLVNKYKRLYCIFYNETLDDEASASEKCNNQNGS